MKTPLIKRGFSINFVIQSCEPISIQFVNWTKQHAPIIASSWGEKHHGIRFSIQKLYATPSRKRTNLNNQNENTECIYWLYCMSWNIRLLSMHWHLISPSTISSLPITHLVARFQTELKVKRITVKVILCFFSLLSSDSLPIFKCILHLYSYSTSIFVMQWNRNCATVQP